MSIRWEWSSLLKTSQGREVDCILSKKRAALPGEANGGAYSAFPELSSADGGREDVQHVSFFQVSALQIAQGDAVHQNERIVLYLPV